MSLSELLKQVQEALSRGVSPDAVVVVSVQMEDDDGRVFAAPFELQVNGDYDVSLLCDQE